MAIIKIKNAAIDLDAAEIPNLPASKITSGTLDNARISLDAAEIPNLDTAKITTGTVATARLGSGTANSTTFLRGDNTFASAGSPSIVDNGNATAITIDSSEQVGIGTSNPTSLLELFKAGTTQIKNAYSSTKYSLFGRTGGNYYWSAYEGGANLIFSTSASDNATTERMRINSAGKVGIGDSTLASDAILSVEGDIGSPLFKLYDKRSTSTVDVMHLNSSFGGTEVKHFQIEADGDVQNTNNSYGSLSDRRFKENETDANSQWNDIKALQIKNYNLKIFPDITHLGVIAQDLEASGMNGLVKNKPEELYTENDVLPEGKNIGDIKEESYKEVKYSVLYMKSVKALQEAMERIETLEAKVTALENA